MSDNQTDPIDFMKSVHVQLTNKARELSRISLVHPHFRQAYIIVLKVRPQYRPTEFTNIRHDKASGEKVRRTPPLVEQIWIYLVPSSVQDMKCADFGSLIILSQDKR